MSTVTYSAEDNKLRLYVGRVPRAEYEALRAAGFTSTPKQSCDFVATWTPRREDLAMEYLAEGEDIGDEDYSPEERAADRAERFEGYREKRTSEAVGHADTFEAGPAAFGHQNAARAERQAIRHDKNRTRAVSQWSKAEYWQQRTAGVIAHALYRSSAHVRRGRILTLEAEQRKHAKSRAEWQETYDAWKLVPTMEGADHKYKHDDETQPAAWQRAYVLCNRSFVDYQHPRADKKASMYSLLTDGADPITPAEAAALYLAKTADPSTIADRWGDHYENRLNYERAMLAQEGGTAAEADMEPGGWIRPSERVQKFNETGEWAQIHRVHKSPTTGRVTSVSVMGRDRYLNDSALKLRTVNVERLPEGNYRAPTDEERQKFAAETKARKTAEKATKAPTIPLLNPTKEDAAKLVELWNAPARAKHEADRKAYRVHGAFEPSTVLEMTQAKYSAISKGTHSSAETRTIHRDGKPSRRTSNMYGGPEARKYDADLGPAACKIRVCGYRPLHVIVLTDKPQTPLPWDAMKQPDAAEVQPITDLFAIA